MKVFFVPSVNGKQPQLIDEAIPRLDGTYCGRWSGQTIEGVRERYPTIELGEFEAYQAQSEAMLRSDPTPCTEEHFTSALECLPPLNWIKAFGYESFKMSERLSGRMTSIYVRSDDGCFYSFVDLDSMRHSDIIARVQLSPHFGVMATEKHAAPV